LALRDGLVAFQFKTEVQINCLTHIFCLWASSHKLYKAHVFVRFIVLKCVFEFEMSEKMVDPLNGNCKINQIVF